MALALLPSVIGCAIDKGGGGGGGSAPTTTGTASTGGSGGATGTASTGGSGGATGTASTGGSGGATSTSGSGGAAPECTVAVDCPPPADPCLVASCADGTCAEAFAPVGTVVPRQAPGDCSLSVCDGAGTVLAANDDADVLDDGLACTLDTCLSGTPQNTPVLAGMPCSQGGGAVCDGAGACVQCVSSASCAAPQVCSPMHQCVAPTCSDAQKDGGESDLDCGGPCGATCGAGMGCAAAADCQSAICLNGHCAAPTCADGSANGGESDVDCGGPCAAKCGPGELCSMATDCTSLACSGTVCLTSCQDGVANGSETAVDCGGPSCLPCMEGQACTGPGDCASGFCADAVCCDTACGGPCVACTAAATGDDTDGKCGPVLAGSGPQLDCPVGPPALCASSPDGQCDGLGACTKWSAGTPCAAATCSGGVASSAATCDGAGACLVASSTPCGLYACSAGACAASCNTGAQCAPGSGCVNHVCVLKKPSGSPCAIGTECQSLVCADGVCCSAVCGGICKSCNLPGSVGTCSTVPAGASDADTCPAPNVCDASGACPGYSPLGKPCADWPGSPSATCNGGYCVDGVCCDSQCLSTCHACNVPGSVGTCVPLANAVDSWPILSFNGCGTANSCPSSCDICGPLATCISETGFFCGSDAQCQSGHCADGVCCSTACDSPCHRCAQVPVNGVCAPELDGTDPAGDCGATGACWGGACKSKPGGPCAQNGDCGIGACIDGVCCAFPCSSGDTCKRCMPGSGQCGFVPAGQDPDDECAGALTCDGNGACQ